MYEEDDLLPISAIQHLAFCPRQCALIHLERAWEESQLTAEGRLLHERAHEQGRELRERVLAVRGLRLRSLGLGLIGQADVVEFHRCSEDDLAGVPLPGRGGLWRPFPVEYKRGRPKPDDIDEVQLCCQALCLEEMLAVSVPAGAIFYGTERRRTGVEFAAHLRARTRDLAVELHRLMQSRATPEARYSAKCESCSLIGHCLPRTVSRRKSVAQYMAAAFTAGDVGGDDA